MPCLTYLFLFPRAWQKLIFFKRLGTRIKQHYYHNGPDSCGSLGPCTCRYQSNSWSPSVLLQTPTFFGQNPLEFPTSGCQLPARTIATWRLVCSCCKRVCCWNLVYCYRRPSTPTKTWMFVRVPHIWVPVYSQDHSYMKTEDGPEIQIIDLA